MQYGTLLIRVAEGKNVRLEKPAIASRMTTRRKSQNSLSSNTKKKLKNCLAMQCSGPSIVLNISDKTVVTSSAIVLSKSHWDEEFLFENVSSAQTIRLYCMDRFAVSKDAEKISISDQGLFTHHPGYIGEISMPIRELIDRGGSILSEWFSLQSDLTKDSSQASIKLTFQFDPTTIDLKGNATTVTDQTELVNIETSLRTTPKKFRAKSFSDYEDEISNDQIDIHTSKSPGEDQDQSESNPSIRTGLVDYFLIIGPRKVTEKKLDVNHPRRSLSLSMDEFQEMHDTEILYRYPAEDKKDFELPTKVEWFSFPDGVEVKYQLQRPPLKILTFVFVGGACGTIRSYGISLITYHEDVQHHLGDLADKNQKSRWIAKSLTFISRMKSIPELSQCLLALYVAFAQDPKNIQEYITNLTTKIPIPIPGVLSIKLGIGPHLPELVFELPEDHDHMNTSQHHTLRCLLRIFTVKNIIRLVSLVLGEQKILFHSRHLSLLTPVTEALTTLIYPFKWHHPYVPILPHILLEYVQAPVPFIIGIHSDWLSEVVEYQQDDSLVFVDLDCGTIEGHHLRDGPPLPSHYTISLYERIRKHLHPPFSSLDSSQSPFYSWLDDQLIMNIRMEFMLFIASLLHGYRDCLFFMNEMMPILNKDRFLGMHAEPESIPFLTRLVNSQIFESFLQNHQDNPELYAFHAIYKNLRYAKINWPNDIQNTMRETGTALALITTTPPHDIILLDFSLSKDQDLPEKNGSERRPAQNPRKKDMTKHQLDIGAVNRLLQHGGEQSDIDSIIGKLNGVESYQPQMYWTVQDLSKKSGITIEILLQRLQRKSIESLDNCNSIIHNDLLLMKDSGSKNDQEIDNIELSLQKFMTKLFSSEEIDDENLLVCKTSFDSSSVRELFLTILTQPMDHFRPQGSPTKSPNGRNSSLEPRQNCRRQCLGNEAFEVLAKLCNKMLEECANKEDYSHAYHLLKISSKYYKLVPYDLGMATSTLDPKQYLQDEIKKQPICRSLDMWQHAMSEEIESEMLPSNKSSTTSMNTMRNHLQHPHNEKPIDEDVFISKIGTLIYEMLSLYVPVDRVNTFVDVMLANYGLPSELKSTLNLLIENLSRAINLSTESHSSPTSPSSSNTAKAALPTHVLKNDKEIVRPPPIQIATAPAPAVQTRYKSSPTLSSRHCPPAGSPSFHLNDVITRRLSCDSAFYPHNQTPPITNSNVEDQIHASTPLSTTNTTLMGHEGAILCLEANRDKILSGGSDGVIQVWQRKPIVCPIPQLTFVGHEAPVSAVHLRENLVISASLDHTVRIWQLRDYSKARHQRNHSYSNIWSLRSSSNVATAASKNLLLRGHSAPVLSMEIGPEMHNYSSQENSSTYVIASGSTDTSIRIWHSNQEQCQSVLIGHTEAVGCLTFSSQHNLLLSGSRDAQIKCWDTSACKLVLSLGGHRSWIRDLQIAGTRLISASNDRRIKVWDIRSGGQQCIASLRGHLGPVTCIRSGGPTDPNVCSGSSDGNVFIWDLRYAGRGPRARLSGHSSSITCLQRNFHQILSGSEDSSLRLWDMHTGKCLSTSTGQHSAGVNCALLLTPEDEHESDSNDTVAISGSWDRTINVWTYERRESEEQRPS